MEGVGSRILEKVGCHERAIEKPLLLWKAWDSLWPLSEVWFLLKTKVFKADAQLMKRLLHKDEDLIRFPAPMETFGCGTMPGIPAEAD